jgi:hypothetical protein
LKKISGSGFEIIRISISQCESPRVFRLGASGSATASRSAMNTIYGSRYFSAAAGVGDRCDLPGTDLCSPLKRRGKHLSGAPTEVESYIGKLESGRKGDIAGRRKVRVPT